MQNCQTASGNQLGWQRKLLPISKVIDETNKIKEKGVVLCSVVCTLKKIFDRSPFTWEFVRYYTVLNPVVLVSFEQKSFFKKHSNLLLNERMKKILCHLPNVMLL